MSREAHFIVLVALIVALGGFPMGVDASVLSGLVTFTEPEFEFTRLQLGWSVASLTLTATLATLVPDRRLGGSGIGEALIIARVYIARIAPPRIRGCVVSSNQLEIGSSGASFSDYPIHRSAERYDVSGRRCQAHAIIRST